MIGNGLNKTLLGNKEISAPVSIKKFKFEVLLKTMRRLPEQPLEADFNGAISFPEEPRKISTKYSIFLSFIIKFIMIKANFLILRSIK